MPEAHSERIFGTLSLRYKYFAIREGTAAQIEDLSELNVPSWLLSVDENTEVNKWVLGFRENAHMLA